VLYTLQTGRQLGWEIEQLTDELAELFGRRSIWFRCGRCTRCFGDRSWQSHGLCMRRDTLLLTEMTEAAMQALSQELTPRR